MKQRLLYIWHNLHQSRSFSFEDDRPLSTRTKIIAVTSILILYALFYSPWWYPLSDSALYLSLARAIATGNGHTYMGEIFTQVPPGTPLLLAAIITLGGGIAAIHITMISLMLIGHLLAYLTLKQWVTPRLALIATCATAISYWVMHAAMTIMSDPLAYALVWGALLSATSLTQPNLKSRVAKQWTLFVLASIMLALAFENRIAVVLLIPGISFAIFILTRNITSPRLRTSWVVILIAVFGLLVFDYTRQRSTRHYKFDRLVTLEQFPGAQKIDPMAPQPFTNTPIQASDEGYTLTDKRNQITDQGPRTFTMKLERLIRRNAQRPYNIGRWISEGLAGPSAAVFQSKNTLINILGLVAGVSAAIIFLVGTIALITHQRWWLLAAIAYAIPIWIRWSDRIKPRYMILIAPVLFITLYFGSRISWAWISKKIKRDNSDNVAKPNGRWIMPVLLILLAVANLPAAAVDIHLRRANASEFYDHARAGSLSELIDIAAHIQRHARANDEIWINRGFFRRVVFYLTGRKIKNLRRDIIIEDPNDTKGFKGFNRALENKSRYYIVFYNQYPWPQWHIPRIKVNKNGPRYWQLFERHRVPGKKAVYKPVNVQSANPSYFQNIPWSAL